MLTGKEECSRCGHLRAVHGAPRDRRGLGCLMHVKTGGGRIGCSCPEFVLYDTTIQPLVGEEDLPPVLPSVEDTSLALGDRVLFRRPLVRKRERLEKERPIRDTCEPEKVLGTERYYEYRRDWVPNERVTMWRPGIVIGKRTLQNGEYVFGGYEEQSYLQNIEYVSAYLIAYDLHQKPVRVLEDDIKPL